MTNYYTKVRRLALPATRPYNDPQKRRYLSDARFKVVGSFVVDRKVFWSYQLPQELTTKLRRKADPRETCIITINLLEFLGMVVTGWVMLEVIGDRTDAKEGPILMRGDNTAAVSWISRCGGRARDERACLPMGMFGRLEIIKGGWYNNIPGASGLH